jgi:hypothetical protein
MRLEEQAWEPHVRTRAEQGQTMDTHMKSPCTEASLEENSRPRTDAPFFAHLVMRRSRKPASPRWGVARKWGWRRKWRGARGGTRTLSGICASQMQTLLCFLKDQPHAPSIVDGFAGQQGWQNMPTASHLNVW